MAALQNNAGSKVAIHVALVIGTLFGSHLVLLADDNLPVQQYDVVVYGATSGGITAAIQSARMGKSVVLFEPGKHLGGMTSGGLGATDIGNKAAIGGLSRNFYERIGLHYREQLSWKYEQRDDLIHGDERAQWVFEPRVAEQVYRTMLAEHKVPVVFGERFDLKNGVEKEGNRIRTLRMESGLLVRGQMFIDATYEGDLMALAGVSYHVGRESNEIYGETLNGVQTKHAISHQFIKPVDPYVTPGDPASGLLPGIRGDALPPDGSGDKGVQAYCFRMCTTDVPENQLPWVKPADYNPQLYELLLRNCEAGDPRIPWSPHLMPNRKTDTNNNFAVSTDFIGASWGYPEGSYEVRERIFREHLSYQQGLMWTLANHSRVPEAIRTHFQKWRPARDEFVETGGWPHQLYIREARRMVSDYVMTQHDCQGRRVADDPVGLAAYTMDSHHIQRHVFDGHVRNEGDVQVGGFAPYPISYRSIRPRESECENLLVPVCLAASHISYGSIRMEPVFMVLGQSAATAACLAIEQNVSVQNVPYAKLRERLLQDGQILEWTGPRPKPAIMAEELEGVVIDDIEAELKGEWTRSRSTGGFVGYTYRHDDNAHKGEMSASFMAKLPRDGDYEVRLYFIPQSNRATNTPVTIESADGKKELTINQRLERKESPYASLGKFRFQANIGARVTISNRGTDGYVVIDAVQFVPLATNASKN